MTKFINVTTYGAGMSMVTKTISISTDNILSVKGKGNRTEITLREKENGENVRILANESQTIIRMRING